MTKQAARLAAQAKAFRWWCAACDTEQTTPSGQPCWVCQSTGHMHLVTRAAYPGEPAL